MMPVEDRRVSPSLQRFLWRHWKGTIIGIGTLAVSLAGVLGFGILTPQAQIAKFGAELDTVRAEVRTARAEGAAAARQQTIERDSLLRLMRIMVAFNCYQLQELQIIVSSLPCPDVPSGYPRARNGRPR
jgi:hypothetical protein